MKKSYLTIIAVLIFTISVFAESRGVYLDKEIRNSLLTEYVEITNYTDSTIVFKIIKNNKIESAKAIGGLVKQGQNESNKFGTDYWPSIGDKVLIVVSQNREVSLFATIQNKNYRFWSPIATGSLAIFSFKKPATNLSGKKGKTVTLQNSRFKNTYIENYQTSYEDGCLLPINKLSELLPINLYSIYSGQAIENNGYAMLKCDATTPDDYYIDKLVKWDEKYLGKKIEIYGLLIEDKNKLVLKNWKIVDK